MPRSRPPLVLLLVLALLVPACSDAGLLNDGRDRTARIGFVTTLEGSDLEAGMGSRNSLELAVREANERRLVPGWKLEVATVNDKADPAVGAQVAAGLAADPSVVAVVDQAYSSVSQATIPVFARQRIAQLSAANTSPSLTLGPFPVDAPKRVWSNYFRLVPNDLLQGDFAANYAFGRAGFRTAATVNDRDLYGQGLVTTFERRWRVLGATVTSSRSVAADEPRLDAVAAAIARERPQVVYFGGQSEAAIQLAERLRGAGYNGPIMGGDAITSTDFIKKVRRSDGTLATTVGGQVDTASPQVKRFAASYQAVFGNAGYTLIGPITYDAGTLMVQAVARALGGAGDIETARPGVIQALGATRDFKGITGSYGFDEYGDTTRRTLTVNQVAGGEWKPILSESLEQ